MMQDENYTFQKMKMYVKIKYLKASEDGFFGMIFEKPLNFVRDISIPPSDAQNWSRNHASVTPVFGYLAFLIFTESKF